jgi:predicted MFS family arabinose efflux permease
MTSEAKDTSNVTSQLMTSVSIPQTPRQREQCKDVSSDSETSREALPAPAEPQRIPILQRVAIFGGIFTALFLGALDQTIVTTALPKIASDFQSNSGYTWVGTSFTLASAAVLPLYGQAANIWGRKWCMLTAIALFALGSALCGSSQSMTMLIASRAVQGLGAGGISGLAFVLIGDMVSTR